MNSGPTQIETLIEISAGETSADAVLGGKLVLRQPLRGHRFGHDSILLAAATSARAGERAVDLGAGVGAAGWRWRAASAGLPSRSSKLIRRLRRSRG